MLLLLLLDAVQDNEAKTETETGHVKLAVDMDKWLGCPGNTV